MTDEADVTEVAPPRQEVIGPRPPSYSPDPGKLPRFAAGLPYPAVPDIELDGATHAGLVLRAASLRGDAHRYRGTPRQDAVRLARIGEGPAELLVLAVADGLGSQEFSQIGSHYACGAALSEIEAVHTDLVRLLRALSHATDFAPASAPAPDWPQPDPGTRRPDDPGAAGTEQAAGRAAEQSANPSHRPGSWPTGWAGNEIISPEQATTRLQRRTQDTVRRIADRMRKLIGYHELRPDQCGTTLRVIVAPTDPRIVHRLLFSVGDGEFKRLRGAEWLDVGHSGPGEGELIGTGTDALPEGWRSARISVEPSLPGDVLVACTDGLSTLLPTPAVSERLAEYWGTGTPPGLAEFLSHLQMRVRSYDDDRSAACLWERSGEQ